MSTSEQLQTSPALRACVQTLVGIKDPCHVDRSGIGIRSGDFYAIRLIESFGLKVQGGVVRVSIAHYNTGDEIERLVRHLDEVHCTSPVNIAVPGCSASRTGKTHV